MCMKKNLTVKIIYKKEEKKLKIKKKLKSGTGDGNVILTIQ